MLSRFTCSGQNQSPQGYTDSATSFFDGLGRSYQSQHVLPGGTATVDTTLDFAGRPATISNPYFSTSDSTYGTTTTLFDGLDRAYSVTKQDGSVSSVAYNVITGVHDRCDWREYVGDCTDTTDEAGKQRRACTDALGRLVQVVEPNPGANVTDASGSVVINGSEQSSTQSGASGNAQITISGGEDLTVICPLNHCHTLYDSGNVSITANGYNKQVTYQQGSTVSTVAAALRDAFHGDTSSPVDASCTDQPCSQSGDYPYGPHLRGWPPITLWPARPRPMIRPISRRHLSVLAVRRRWQADATQLPRLIPARSPLR